LGQPWAATNLDTTLGKVLDTAEVGQRFWTPLGVATNFGKSGVPKGFGHLWGRTVWRSLLCHAFSPHLGGSKNLFTPGEHIFGHPCRVINFRKPWRTQYFDSPGMGHKFWEFFWSIFWTVLRSHKFEHPWMAQNFVTFVKGQKFGHPLEGPQFCTQMGAHILDTHCVGHTFRHPVVGHTIWTSMGGSTKFGHTSGTHIGHPCFGSRILCTPGRGTKFVHPWWNTFWTSQWSHKFWKLHESKNFGHPCGAANFGQFWRAQYLDTSGMGHKFRELFWGTHFRHSWKATNFEPPWTAQNFHKFVLG
jgi:hypothetical protein